MYVRQAAQCHQAIKPSSQSKDYSPLPPQGELGSG